MKLRGYKILQLLDECKQSEVALAAHTFLDNSEICAAGLAAGHSGASPPEPTEEDIAAREENQDTLNSIMRARFLSGKDPSVNYKDIDDDASLDHYWAAQIDQDAQDRYFEED